VLYITNKGESVSAIGGVGCKVKSILNHSPQMGILGSARYCTSVLYITNKGGSVSAIGGVGCRGVAQECKAPKGGVLIQHLPPIP
jgi:hypothetical protein